MATTNPQNKKIGVYISNESAINNKKGKSTLFKRLLIEYGDGYSEEQRVDFAESIFENTVTTMKTLIKESILLDPELGTRVSQIKKKRERGEGLGGW